MRTAELMSALERESKKTQRIIDATNKQIVKWNARIDRLQKPESPKEETN